MIMRLNLLPEEECRKLEMEQLLAFLRREMLFLVFITMIVGSVVWYAGSALSGNIEAMRESVFSNKELDKDLMESVAKLNGTAKNISVVQSLFFRQSALLSEFASITPSDIRINKLLINSELVQIEGEYRRREELLRFRENLMNEFLTDIEFPIANLLKQEDGEFTIRGKISQRMRDKMMVL
ncbi:MAG: hypothetical protein HY564_02860 [Candidatus Jacksonbacteria bacterium]|nr:hypothetical protein [Candidatus Jacksonbacteria bacterium]